MPATVDVLGAAEGGVYEGVAPPELGVETGGTYGCGATVAVAGELNK
jgi:hypothetical protein